MFIKSFHSINIALERTQNVIAVIENTQDKERILDIVLKFI